MREFFRGVGFLVRGFGWWGRIPRQMAWGLLPAAIAWLILAAALIGFASTLPALTTTATPFAETWHPSWAILFRIGLGTAAFAGAIVLAVVSYTAVALIIGEPFYSRIWQRVETSLGTDAALTEPGLGTSILDGAILVGRGLVAALLTAAVGFVPLVGGPLAFATGLVLGGRILADELTSRSLSAHGVDRDGRDHLRTAHRARFWGFGIATQACFLIPFGAVLVMPAAVAGATQLARTVLPAPVR